MQKVSERAERGSRIDKTGSKLANTARQLLQEDHIGFGVTKGCH